LSATTTYTLTCTGPGGTANQSVTVTATAAAGKSGGGGTLDPAWLLLAAGLCVLREWRVRLPAGIPARRRD
jgi:hypothetical protein